MGKRNMTWLSSAHPDMPKLSQAFQLWARSWGHIRATCESGGITHELCREYGLEICFCHVSPELSVSVSAPLDVAAIDVITESNDPSCPWSTSMFNLERSQPSIKHTNGKTSVQEKVKHCMSGPEMNIERKKKGNTCNKGVLKRNMEDSPKGLSWRTCY